MTFKTSLGALLLLAMATASVQAQKITSIQVEPAKAEVGQAVKATTQFEVNSNGAINCKVRVHFGDGNTVDFKVNQTKDVPLVLEHSYAKPGTYTVMVEGKGGSKCLGDDQSASVAIVAKPAPAPMASTPAATVCPKGWKLTKAGVNKKTAAFTCTAKANTPIPEPKLTCANDLTYFDNVKKGQMGCKV